MAGPKSGNPMLGVGDSAHWASWHKCASSEHRRAAQCGVSGSSLKAGHPGNPKAQVAVYLLSSALFYLHNNLLAKRIPGAESRNGGRMPAPCGSAHVILETTLRDDVLRIPVSTADAEAGTSCPRMDVVKGHRLRGSACEWHQPGGRTMTPPATGVSVLASCRENTFTRLTDDQSFIPDVLCSGPSFSPAASPH